MKTEGPTDDATEWPLARQLGDLWDEKDFWHYEKALRQLSYV